MGDPRQDFIEKSKRLASGEVRFNDGTGDDREFKKKLDACKEPRERFLLLSDQLSKTGRFHADDGRTGAYDNGTSNTGQDPRSKFIQQSQANFRQDTGGIQGRRVTRFDRYQLKPGETIIGNHGISRPTGETVEDEEEEEERLYGHSVR